MSSPLRLLLIADSADAALVLDELRAGDYDPSHERLECSAAVRAALACEPPDLVIAFSHMPGFSAQEVLSSLRETGNDAPLIVLMKEGDEVGALRLIKMGVDDCLMAGELNRLASTVERRLCEVRRRHDREQLTRELQESRQRLQTLSASILQIQEAERQHIALELHDEIGQALTAVKIHLEALCRTPAAAAVAGQLQAGLPVVDRAIEQVRKLALALRPSQLDDLGLASALRGLVAHQADLGGWVAHVDADPPPNRCDPRVEIACFRVAQEALTNVARHAQAHQVWIELHQRADELHLYIRDDGKGFDVAAARKRALTGASLGLIGMEDRVELAGGRLSWDSDPARGTRLHVVFPLVSSGELRRRWRDRIEGRRD